MTTIINTKPTFYAPPYLDFGWYLGSIGNPTSPSRKPEYLYSADNENFPPGHSTLTSSITLPQSTIFVNSTASFDVSGSGTLVINDGTKFAVVNYAAVNESANSFTGCTTKSTATFAAETPVWDPRFYVDSVPLYETVTFDATDSLGLGLPTVMTPSGVDIVWYWWNFGNGEVGTGPQASTIYEYGQAPPSAFVSLTVRDALGRYASVSHPLYFVSATSASLHPVISLRGSELGIKNARPANILLGAHGVQVDQSLTTDSSYH